VLNVITGDEPAMTGNRRQVTPELLDELAPDDPRARRSRRDLRRVHVAMRSVSILRRAVDRLGIAAPPRRLLELGAGDGTLLLRLGRAMYPEWRGTEVTLLDRQDIVSAETRASYQELGWPVAVLREDVMVWARAASAQRYDLVVASLFLHHFDAPALTDLLAAVAGRTDALVVCEPRRDTLARWGSRLIGLLGTNAVTREDAVTSVAAGFAGQELSALWPTTPERWFTEEWHAWPFTHCFAAIRAAARAPEKRLGR
jgi:SAM-dependent methyltransferase